MRLHLAVWQRSGGKGQLDAPAVLGEIVAGLEVSCSIAFVCDDMPMSAFKPA